ncbi:MAG: hypothetical protein COB49_10050 [Alphaproteobacteria bacterium]|nr:MAG: hypothetical protein COB49_10050 [Alphaproteobacteria bacterium]
MTKTETIDIIVHGTASGPDYHRLVTILALKNVPWSFSPRPPAILKGLCDDFPIMQYGPCYFEGSIIATLALEQLQPNPSLFPNGNCGMPLALSWWSDSFYKSGNDPALLQKNCVLISRQIADGRYFLQGATPGLADVHSFAPLKALQHDGHDISSVLKADSLLQSWYQRMDQLAPGGKTATLPRISSTDYPECDLISDKIILKDSHIILWKNSFPKK